VANMGDRDYRPKTVIDASKGMLSMSLPSFNTRSTVPVGGLPAHTGTGTPPLGPCTNNFFSCVCVWGGGRGAVLASQNDQTATQQLVEDYINLNLITVLYRFSPCITGH
jgi:hypothetical protein